MVQVENILENAFGDLPLIDGRKVVFGYGEQKELNAVLTARQNNEQKAYPLLWYVMPNELKGKLDGSANGSLTFVIATNTTSEWFNDQRFKYSFNQILQPIFDAVVRTINQNPDIEFIENTDGSYYSFINFPNYGDDRVRDGKVKQETKQVDFWDAIKFTVNLYINGGISCNPFN